MADGPEHQEEEVEREARGWAVVFGMVATGAVVAGLALAVGVGILLGFYVIGNGSTSSTKTVAVTPSSATSTSTSTASSPSGTSTIALAPTFTAAQLSALPSDNWITNGGSTMNERYSPLSQINASNISSVKGVWEDHLGTATAAIYSAEGQPLEYDGTLYESTGSDNVFAISVATGKVLWRYNAKLPAELPTVCCGWDNRGVALGGGLVYISQLNGKLVALDQRTGAVVWSKQVVSEPAGYTFTAAPLYYDGRVYTAPSGGEFEIRGFMSAFNAKTGALEWRFYTVPGPGQTGFNTWPQTGTAWKRGGGGVWNTPSLDPSLHMLYFSTSNASPWDGRQRPGDNLFDSSIVALNTDTGKLEWYYQEVHHDVWDYDAPSPTVLFNAMVDGSEREAIAEPGKTGFLYVLDRKTGKPIFPIPEKAVPYNPEQLTARTQPFPSLAFSPHTVTASQVALLSAAAAEAGAAGKALKITAGSVFTGSARIGNDTTAVAPSAAGGDNWPPSSFDPSTDDYYVCSQSGAEAFTIPSKVAAYVKGKDDLGLDQVATTGFDTPGLITAFDMDTGKIAWQVHLPSSCYSGAVSTAGNLVFVGNNNGELQAFNATSGAKVWSFQTGGGANDTVTPFEYKGTEEIAFYAGGNALAATGHADNFWLFSLKGKLPQAAAPTLGTGIQHAGTAEPKNGASGSSGVSGASGNTGTTTSAALSPKAEIAAGKMVFAANCGTCHTLADAGTNGDVGPNLDDLKPNDATVTHQVINGGGAMPAFGNNHLLTATQIKEVALYVSTVAGKS